MKYFRYLFVIILIVSALIFGNELFQVYLFDFEDFSNVSFYLQDDISFEDMKTDIFSSASEYDVEVFFVEKNVNGDYYTEINIYSNDFIRQYLQERYYLSPGEKTSLFSGTSKISFFDTSQLSFNTMLKHPNGYYLLGNMEDIYKYKNSFSDIYGGKIPSSPRKSSVNQAGIKLLWIWMAVGLLIFISSYCYVVKERKEIVVRLTMGESVNRIIFVDCLIESVLYFMTFVFSIFLLYRNFATFFLCKETVAMFCGAMIINISTHLLLLRTNVKLAFSNYRISYSVLMVEYFIRILLILTLAVSAATGINTINKYVSMKHQIPFYEQYKDYDYIVLKNSKSIPIYNLECKFYYDYLEEDISYTGMYAQYGDYSSNKIVIGVNPNLKNYLLTEIPEIEHELIGCYGALLLPKNKKLSQQELDSLRLYAAGFADCALEEVKVIYYNNGKRINYYDNYSGYERERNPVIVFDNTPIDNKKFEVGQGIPVFFQKCLCKVSEEEIEKFCEVNECSYTLSNVWECFLFEMTKVKRGALIYALLFTFQLCLLFFVGLSIIRMEFEMNRLEIILRKINGEPFYSRVKKYVSPSVISGVISVLGMVIAYKILNRPLNAFVPTFFIMIIVMEVVIDLVYFCKVEKESFQKTLKGGF